MNRTTGFNGTRLALAGKALTVGTRVPPFVLTGGDMKDLTPADFVGKVLVILAVPSLDTPTCSIETKQFSSQLTKAGASVALLAVSRDLPFAQKRWCATEGAPNVVTGSDFKYRTFGEQFGVEIPEWALLSRAVFVADTSGVLQYVEYVPEIPSEPDYASALKAIHALTR